MKQEGRTRLGLQCQTHGFPLVYSLFYIENLGEDSCSCYQAKVKSTPSLCLELKIWPRTGV